MLAHACCLTAAAGSWADERPGKHTQGFVALYNGKNLDGWRVKDGALKSWQADGELLSCIAAGGGWLVTEKQYSDFELKLEYRIPAGGNSGVGLRVPPEGNPAHEGMEIQILDDADRPEGDLEPEQYTGSIYGQVAARRGASKPPGQWNALAVTLRANLIKIELNGQPLVETALDEQVEGKGGHKPLADRPQTGFLALQSHGSRVDFRNIEIKDLTTTTKSDLIWVDQAEGKGGTVPEGGTVVVHYTGRFTHGAKFDSSRDGGKPIEFSLGGVIKGFSEGLVGMRAGGRRKLIIPPGLGYGDRPVGPIPANSTLVFDVQVVEVK